MCIPTLIGITLLVQLFMVITPGDPARLLAGEQASEEELEQLRIEMGLNDPFIVRYGNYMKNMFHGDFGTSFRTKTPVIQEIRHRIFYTLRLVIISLILAICLGIPIGIYAATHQYTWKDNAAVLLSLFFVSMPSFWFSLLLIRFFCVKLHLLPVAGIDTWKGWILPCFVVCLAYMSGIVRQMRSNMLEVIRQDYISTARAKGQSERKVLYKHALQNAIIPIIMTIGSIFGHALGGSIVIETIFALPGLGNYTVTALQTRDYPVIQTSVLFLSIFSMIVLLLTDVAFALVDPRIRAQFARQGRRRAHKKASTEAAADAA